MPDIIRPEQLNNRVTGAFFTEANRHIRVEGSLYQGLNIGFNTRDSSEQIQKTAEFILKSLGHKASQLALGKQIHSTCSYLVSKPGVYEDSDGLVTTQRGIILGIQVADCAAILIADTKNGVIGAFHAGWRGAAGGIVSKGVSQMRKAGAELRYMYGYISPCIRMENFEVGQEVAAQFPDRFCDYDSYEKPHVDLKKFLESELLEAGISEMNIEQSDQCTMASSRFFSYRREKEQAGRMLAAIYLKHPSVAS